MNRNKKTCTGKNEKSFKQKRKNMNYRKRKRRQILIKCKVEKINEENLIL